MTQTCSPDTPKNRVIIHETVEGWRGYLYGPGPFGQMLDSTVDVYPSSKSLMKHIHETKTWFDGPDDDPQPPAPLFSEPG